MKYFSMFSGIGGFELGIQRAYSNKQSAEIKQDGQGRDRDANEGGNDVLSASGSTPLCIGFSEVDKYAISIYQKHFPDHKGFGDANKIRTDELPDFDFLVGGFPCQAFSIAGKRAGFQDTRGTLFFEIARILTDKRPRYFLLENVKGLLSHDNGKTFQTILKVLTDIGYYVEWQVLNSKDFGVPQNRERVFIVGHLGGGSGRKVFPVRKDDGVSSRTHKDGEGFREMKENICPTIPARAREDGSGQPIVAIPVLTPDRQEKRQNGRRMKEDGEPAFTLTAQDKHGVYDGYRIRRLTPTECERLQGFPDGWTEGISDSQRYKCLGNAVTVNVIEAIMNRIKDTLHD